MTENAFSGTEKRIIDLECEISILKERNVRVEIDKAWEISLTRTITIVLLTYFVTALAFSIAFSIEIERVRGAVIPKAVAAEESDGSWRKSSISPQVWSIPRGHNQSQSNPFSRSG